VYVTTESYFKEGNVLDCSVDEGYTIKLPASLIADGMKLGWNGQEGQYVDERGILIAFDPSVRQTDPGALLVRKDSFVQFLHEHNYEIFWTLLGEKNDYSAGYDEDWKGRLEISGAYRLQRRIVSGSFRTRFVTRGSR
jgi:hypothetical protein